MKKLDSRGRVVGASPCRRSDQENMRERFAALFGDSNLNTRLQLALNRGHSSVDSILAGKNVPFEVTKIVELLEATPRSLWPLPWRHMSREGPDHASDGMPNRICEFRKARQMTLDDVAREAGVTGSLMWALEHERNGMKLSDRWKEKLGAVFGVDGFELEN
jgi:DNA-binding XRE family transcriptional regulator